MVGTITLIVYLGVYPFAWIFCTRWLARLIGEIASLDSGDKVMAVALGMWLALFWPLFIPGAWIYSKAFPKKEDSQ